MTCVHTLSGECVADVVLVIDTSASINVDDGENWSNVLDFIRNTIYSLDVGTNRSRVAAVTFSDEAFLQWDLDDYMRKEDLLDVVDNIPYDAGQDTNTTGTSTNLPSRYVQHKGHLRGHFIMGP